MNHSTRPRLGSIIWTDWPALFCLICVPAIWLIGFAFPRGVHFGTFERLTLTLPVSLLAGGFLIWRVIRIHHLFAHGHSVRGQISGVQITGDRGRLEFTYSFEGREFRSWTPVHKNNLVLALQTNQEVEVLVNPASPDNAIVRRLYL